MKALLNKEETERNKLRRKRRNMLNKRDRTRRKAAMRNRKKGFV
jgi:hypothetical protein